MRRATYKDRDKAINILCRSFINILIPNSINFVVKKDGNREKRLMALMSYQFDIAMMYGNVFLSDDEKACILYLDKMKFSLKRILLEIKLVISCIGIENVPRVLKREKLLKAYHPEQKFIHLWLMGALPEEQGKGIGSKLLQESMATYSGELIYLETTTPENLKFYKKNGFTIFHETHELDYPLYFLKHV